MKEVDKVTKPDKVYKLLGSHGNKEREKDDFYRTPEEAVEALLFLEDFEGTIWECACGDGAISKVLDRAGYKVVSTDLIDRGYGIKGYDFLREGNKYTADNIVTNPPYKLALPFVKRALERSKKKVAMLLRIQFLEGKERGEFFKENPPARVIVFSNRISCLKPGESKGTDAMCYCWFIWDKEYKGEPTIRWIRSDLL